MTFGKYLALDDKLVSQAQEVAALNSEGEICTGIPQYTYNMLYTLAHSAVLRGALSVLEGNEAADIREISEQIGLSAEVTLSHCQAMASLTWEFVKSAPSDEVAVTTALHSVGISDEFSAVFARSYFENRRRLTALKGSLNVSATRYKDLSWRLDMEVLQYIYCRTDYLHL